MQSGDALTLFSRRHHPHPFWSNGGFGSTTVLHGPMAWVLGIGIALVPLVIVGTILWFAVRNRRQTTFGSAPAGERSGSSVWLLVAGGVVVVVTVAVGVWFTMFYDDGSGSDTAGTASNGTPKIPAGAGNGSAAGVTLNPAAGGQTNVSGVSKNETIACNDGVVHVSGVTNTVTITGHCVNVTVSGSQNHVTVDAADAISASGLSNQVTFHSGSPQIDNFGNNVVQQG